MLNKVVGIKQRKELLNGVQKHAVYLARMKEQYGKRVKRDQLACTNLASCGSS